MGKTAIIGAGISGLTTAFALLEESRKRGTEADLVILEADTRPGGKIRTDSVDGYLCEWGPNGFLNNSPPTLELCSMLGVGARLVGASEAASKNRFLLLSGRLEPVPISPPSFLRSPILPFWSRLRVALEPFIPRGKGEETVLEFASRRLGRGLATTLVDAMVTGIYGGDPGELSVDAAFPRLRRLETNHGSLIRGAIALAREKRRKRKSEGGDRDGPAIQTGPSGSLTSLRGGLGELIDALVQRIGLEKIELGTPVAAIVEAENGLEVRTSAGGIPVDQVVVTVPSYRAAPMLSGLSEELARGLEDFPYAPVAVVCLGFEAKKVTRTPEGFGFLVPGREGLPILGCLFSSSIYPGRAPEGRVLLRAMLGGRRQGRIVEEGEEILLSKTLELLRPVLGLEGDPELVRIYRYPRAIPQYTLGHLDRVAKVEALADRWPGLHLSGNSYHGVAMNNCVENAFDLGKRLAGGG